MDPAHLRADAPAAETAGHGESFGADPRRRPLAVEHWYVRPAMAVSLLAMVSYAVFRFTTFFGPEVFWPANLLLFTGELLAIAAQVALVFDAWRLPAYDPPRGTRRPPIDVLVPVYDEPVEVLRPTLAGCIGQDYDGPLRVWLLDDGSDPERAELARALGVEYVTRPDHRGAKAGNLNHALELLDGELVTVLDCDMVPQPDYVSTLVPYFEDERVALVQTPHGFYNGDSFQHFSETRHDQSLFYDVLQWGKDRHNSAYWCGTGGMLRTEALRQVGGVAEATITEDFHTSILLHEAGWRSRYHPVALSFGLGATDHATYASQRDRWGAGNISALHTRDSPLWARGLTWRQRLSYVATLIGVLAGLRRVCFVLGVAVVLGTGRIPFSARPEVLLPILTAAVVGGLAGVLALGRGRVAVGDLGRGEILALPAQLSALRMLTTHTRRRGGFDVTAKDSTVEHWTVFVRTNRSLLALSICLAFGIVVGAVRQLQGVGLEPFAAWLTFLLAFWEASQLALAWRFGLRYRQRRTLFRVEMDGYPARLHRRGGVIPVRTMDLSPGGAAVEMIADLDLRFGEQVGYSTHDMPMPIACTVRRARGREVGLDFHDVPPRSGVVVDRMAYIDALLPDATVPELPDGLGADRPVGADEDEPSTEGAALTTP